jgi:hypothetical protein
MNAMLEPRIVAASTHGREAGTQGDCTAAVVNTSVHGCFILIPMLTDQEGIPSWNTGIVSFLGRMNTEIATTTSFVGTALAKLGRLTSRAARISTSE